MNHLQGNSPPQGKFNMASYQYALLNCMNGPELTERGQRYRTADAAVVVFDSNESILFNFPERKLNAGYAVEEFLWYARGDRYDDSIEQHATAWKKLKQADGSYNSNYGHYIFSKMNPEGVSQFQFAAEELMRNRDTRRAAFPLLETRHCYHENTDMVCTFAIQFFVRGEYLNMIVSMRSNDAIWGLTNDAFCFSMLHRLMHASLLSTYPGLRLGAYTHIANTLHVYDRHYDMATKIIETDLRDVTLIDVPMFTQEDVRKLVVERTTENLPWALKLVSTGP